MQYHFFNTKKYTKANASNNKIVLINTNLWSESFYQLAGYEVLSNSPILSDFNISYAFSECPNLGYFKYPFH